MSESGYVPSPTFSERMAKRQKSDLENISTNESTAPEIKKTINNLPAFDDLVRQHHLPLVLKSRNGDSLQVYLHSYPRLEEEVLVYDVEFDDGTVKQSVPRSAISLPPPSSYQLMMLQQESQASKTITPQKRHKNRR